MKNPTTNNNGDAKAGGDPRKGRGRTY